MVSAPSAARFDPMRSPPRAPHEPPWLPVARAELGVHETAGPGATARIVEFHAATTLRARSDEVPWCSAFVCWVFEPVIGGPTRFGFRSTRSALARSWCSWGSALTEPVVGCVVVFRRGSSPTAGHVGFVAGWSASRIDCLGANQRDAVTVAPFPRADVLAYRWPAIPFGREFDT